MDRLILTGNVACHVMPFGQIENNQYTDGYRMSISSLQDDSWLVGAVRLFWTYLTNYLTNQLPQEPEPFSIVD